MSPPARVQRESSETARCTSTEDCLARPLILLFQARSLSLQGWRLLDLPLRATFSPAHPLARRDVPLAQARAFRFPITLFRGVAKAALYCAHRTSTVSSCAFCEQEGHLAAPSHPSEAARCASKEDHQAPSLFCSGSKGSAWVSFHPFHRRASASKKDIWPLPLFLSPTSQLSRHLRLLTDLPRGTPPHRASVSSNPATTF